MRIHSARHPRPSKRLRTESIITNIGLVISLFASHSPRAFIFFFSGTFPTTTAMVSARRATPSVPVGAPDRWQAIASTRPPAACMHGRARADGVSARAPSRSLPNSSMTSSSARVRTEPTSTTLLGWGCVSPVTHGVRRAADLAWKHARPAMVLSGRTDSARLGAVQERA